MKLAARRGPARFDSSVASGKYDLRAALTSLIQVHYEWVYTIPFKADAHPGCGGLPLPKDGMK